MRPQELVLFLKERVPRTIEETSKLAEQYIEAYGGLLVANRSTRSTAPAVNRPSQSTNTQPQHSSQRSVPRSDWSKKCFICHKDGHFANDCQKNRKNKTAAAAQEQDEQLARCRKNRRQSVQRSQSLQDWRKRDHDKREENSRTTAGVSCQSTPSHKPQSQIEGCVKDDRLQLANGKSLPYAGAPYNEKIRNDLPLCQGFVGNHPMDVLRDTGCNRAAEKKDLIDKSQLSGRISSCVLMDGSLRNFSMATAMVGTPCYTGKVEAMCMPNHDLIHDLIIDNIPGVKPAPDLEWQPSSAPTEGAFPQLKRRKSTVKSWGSNRRVKNCLASCGNTPRRSVSFPARTSVLTGTYHCASRDNNGDSPNCGSCNAAQTSDKTGTWVESWWLFRLQENSWSHNLYLLYGLASMVTSQDSADRVTYASERFQKEKSPKFLWVRCPLWCPFDAPFERIVVDLVWPIAPVISNTRYKYFIAAIMVLRTDLGRSERLYITIVDRANQF